MIIHLHRPISTEIPRIFDMIVECTLKMLEPNFHCYPDHRSKLFELLSWMNTYCFENIIFNLKEEKLRLYINTLLWGIKHEHPTISQSVLEILNKFLGQIKTKLNPDQYNPFFKAFYFEIFRDTLQILTDTMHTTGLKLQTTVIFELTKQCITSADLFVFSRQEVQQNIALNLKNNNLANVTSWQVEIFVLDLFNKCDWNSNTVNEAFSTHIKDFLIQLKVFGGPEEEWERERQEAIDRSKQQQTNAHILQQQQVSWEYDLKYMEIESYFKKWIFNTCSYIFY